MSPVKGSMDDLPDVHDLGAERLMLLWVLYRSKQGGEPWMSGAEASRVLRDAYSIDIPRQRAVAILNREKGSVSRSGSRRGPRRFQVMRVGEQELRSAGPTVVFVEPAKALSKVREVQEILAGLKGQLRVCDPYIDGASLDALANCSASGDILYLSQNLSVKKEVLKRDLLAFEREHSKRVVVRAAPPKHLHDRYIIHEGGLLVLGGSLSGLGTRQTFVTAHGKDLADATQRAFDDLWAVSKDL